MNEIKSMTAEEVLEGLKTVERDRARLDARAAWLFARFAELRADRPRYVADEIAVELRWTPTFAGNQLADAVELVDELPNTLAALEAGEIDWVRATTIVHHTTVLDPEPRHQVEAAILPYALGERKANVVTEFRVTIPASSLAGASAAPGEAHGYGTLTNDIIHKLAAGPNVFWRRITTDPKTGTVMDVGPRRRHTVAIGEFVKTRDRWCVFPGCTRPAHAWRVDGGSFTRRRSQNRA